MTSIQPQNYLDTQYYVTVLYVYAASVPKIYLGCLEFHSLFFKVILQGRRLMKKGVSVVFLL